MDYESCIVKLNDEQYFALNRASNSLLSHMLPTPAHCKEYLDNPPEQTPAMALGSLAHCLILEPEMFGDKFAVKPDNIDRRTKVGKAQWQAFLTESEGKTVVTTETMTQAKGICEGVLLGNDTAATLLQKPGQAEVAALWVDPEIPLQCKAKYDYLTDDGIIVDIKTTRDASPSGFAKSVAQFGYHRQAAFYSRGYAQVKGTPPKAFVFIAVETAAPYACAVYVLDEESLYVGGDRVLELLRQYKTCAETSTWPGYDQSCQTISLPGWAKQ